MIKNTAILVLSIIISLISSSTVMANNSQLQQEILPQDCSYTTVETGNGVVNDIDCPTFPPVIDNVDVNGGRPVVVGVYDAVHTAELKVWVDGRWYVYGVDRELTTSGNVWTFRMSSDSNKLDTGQYIFKVETVDHGGVLQSGQTEFTIKSVKPDGDTQGTDDGYIIPGIPNTGIARASIFSIFFIGFVFLPLVLLFRRKKRQSDKDL